MIEEITSSPKYLKIWLEIMKLVNDKEEVFVYMYLNDIATNNPEFYSKWFSLYEKRK